MSLPNLAGLSLKSKEEAPVNASVHLSALNLSANPALSRAQVHDRAYQYFHQRYLSNAPDDNDTDIDYVHHLGNSWATDGDPQFWNRLLTYTDAQGNQQIAQVPANWANAGPDAIIRLTPLPPSQGDHVYFCSKIFLFTAWAMQRRDHPNANYPAAFKNPWTREPFVPPQALYDAAGNLLNGAEINDMRTLRDDFLFECSGYWADPAQTIPLFDPQGGIPYGNNPFPAGAAWDAQANNNNANVGPQGFDPSQIRDFLEPATPLAQKRFALQAVKDMATVSVDQVDTLMQMGFVQRIVPLLNPASENPTPEERQLQRLAAEALTEMLKEHLEVREIAWNANALPTLRMMLIRGWTDARGEAAAMALSYLIERHDEYMDALLATGQPQVMPYLQWMLGRAAESGNEGVIDYDKAYAVVRLLSPIATSDRYAHRIVSGGFVGRLINLLSGNQVLEQPFGFQAQLTGILSNLAEPGRVDGFMPKLQEGDLLNSLLRRISNVIKRHARVIPDAEELQQSATTMRNLDMLLLYLVDDGREQQVMDLTEKLVSSLMRAIPLYPDLGFLSTLESLVLKTQKARQQFMSFRGSNGVDGVTLLGNMLQDTIMINGKVAALMIRALTGKDEADWTRRMANHSRLLYGLISNALMEDDESRQDYLKALIDMTDSFDGQGGLRTDVVMHIYLLRDPPSAISALVDLVDGRRTDVGNHSSLQTKALAADLLGRIARAVGTEAKDDMLAHGAIEALVDFLKEESDNERPAPRGSAAVDALTELANDHPPTQERLARLGVVGPPYRYWRKRNLQ